MRVRRRVRADMDGIDRRESLNPPTHRDHKIARSGLLPRFADFDDSRAPVPYPWRRNRIDERQIDLPRPSVRGPAQQHRNWGTRVIEVKHPAE